MNILVFGRTGQIARELNKLVSATFLSRKECDLLNPTNCAEEVTRSNADIVINLAAYTNVDRAEEEQDLAKVVNGEAPAAIAIACASKGIPFIHISTDYVYGDNGQFPITSTTEANPVNIYGKTKLIGDLGIINSGADYVILRTSWVYSVYGNNFVKTMIRLMKDNDYVKVIYDQIGSPTNAEDLASTIISIINFKYWYPGVYNYSNAGEVSWHDFATIIKEIGKFDCNIYPIKSSDFKTKASRPMYSVLDKTKIKEIYKINIPHYKDSLRKCLINFK